MIVTVLGVADLDIKMMVTIFNMAVLEIKLMVTLLTWQSWISR